MRTTFQISPIPNFITHSSADVYDVAKFLHVDLGEIGMQMGLSKTNGTAYQKVVDAILYSQGDQITIAFIRRAVEILVSGGKIDWRAFRADYDRIVGSWGPRGKKIVAVRSAMNE